MSFALELIDALIVCPGCRKLGAVGMERPLSAPVRTSAGFHLEGGRTSAHEILIVCDDCDTAFSSAPV